MLPCLPLYDLPPAAAHPRHTLLPPPSLHGHALLTRCLVRFVALSVFQKWIEGNCVGEVFIPGLEQLNDHCGIQFAV